jgi:hypothetical protein
VQDNEGVTVLHTWPSSDNPEDLEDAQFILEEYRRAFDGLGAAGDEPVMAVLTQVRLLDLDWSCTAFLGGLVSPVCYSNKQRP